MANSKAEEIVRRMLSGEVQELELKDLEGVSGGAITASEESLLVWGIKLAKQNNLSVQDILDFIPQYYDTYHRLYPNVTVEDVTDYLNKHWGEY